LLGPNRLLNGQLVSCVRLVVSQLGWVPAKVGWVLASRADEP